MKYQTKMHLTIDEQKRLRKIGAWRVFVAKIQSNRASASEWLSVRDKEVTGEEFTTAARRLFKSDGAGLDKLLQKKWGPAPIL